MFLKLLRKLISLYVYLRYRSIGPELRYFYRDTYYCKLTQWQYFFRDYIFKKRYKVISFDGEFAPELQFVLPFAYWHYKNGTLKKTESSTYTKELYFFSPCHQEKFSMRTNEGNYNYEMPRILYSNDYNMDKWEPVPLKDHYKNDIYVYDKPVLVIANRYNMEWDGPPISFFDIPMLSFMIEKLRDKFTIIYNRPRPQHITMDNSDVYELDEYQWIKDNHPDVILMEDLYKENRGGASSFNHLQCLIYANAGHFISIHGGTATLASYFEGTNLIFSKQGPEHHFGCYQKLYPKLSGANILHARNEEEVRNYILNHFI